MDNFSQLGLITFLIVLYIGLLIVYLKEPRPKIVSKYPVLEFAIIIGFAVIVKIATSLID